MPLLICGIVVCVLAGVLNINGNVGDHADLGLAIQHAAQPPAVDGYCDSERLAESVLYEPVGSSS